MFWKTFLSAAFISITIALISSLAAETAGESTATVTRIEGKGNLLVAPRDTLPAGDAKNIVKFEGKYYRMEEPSVGTKVKPGEVVQSTLNGRMRLVFANGDQITVGPGTSYRLAEGGKDGGMDLDYGTVRAVISSEGPRKKFNIRTKSATMGIRGTDFTVAYRGANKETEVSVLRGKVNLKPKAENAPAVPIDSGKTAVLIEPKKDQPKEAAIPKVFETSKVELAKIQEETTVPVSKTEPAQQLEEIKKLEEASAKNVVEDLKKHRPELVKGSDVAALNVDQLNSLTVKEQFDRAPAKSDRPKEALPVKIDPDKYQQLEREDFYKKYYKK